MIAKCLKVKNRHVGASFVPAGTCFIDIAFITQPRMMEERKRKSVNGRDDDESVFFKDVWERGRTQSLFFFAISLNFSISSKIDYLKKVRGAA